MPHEAKRYVYTGWSVCSCCYDYLNTAAKARAFRAAKRRSRHSWRCDLDIELSDDDPRIEMDDDCIIETDEGRYWIYDFDEDVWHDGGPSKEVSV